VVERALDAPVHHLALRQAGAHVRAVAVHHHGHAAASRHATSSSPNSFTALGGAFSSFDNIATYQLADNLV